MNKPIVFKISYGKRIRVVYGSGRDGRGFIYADHVPAAKLNKLVRSVNNCHTPQRMRIFMARSLGYTSGEFDASRKADIVMLVRLMREKIAFLGHAARKAYRDRLAHGAKRPKPQRANDSIPSSNVFVIVANAVSRIAKEIDRAKENPRMARSYRDDIRETLDNGIKQLTELKANL